MDIPVDLLQKAADHRKACEHCKNRANRELCDEAAEINMELLKASFS